MREYFEHTADIGIRVICPTLQDIFVEAGLALFELITEKIIDVKPIQSVPIQLKQKDRDLLLFDWLNQLLYLFETQHWLFSRFEIILSVDGLEAVAYGEPCDSQRHPPSHEVKAITYHQLKLEQQSDGDWLAEVIVDI